MPHAPNLKELVIGLTRLAGTQPDIALRQIESLLAQSPRLVPARCLAARLSRQAGHYDAALEHLDAALAEDPDAIPAIAEKGALAATRSDYVEAARCFRKLTDLGHRHHDVFFNLALAEEKLGRFDNAIDAFRDCLAAGPSDGPAVRARLGGALAASGRDAEARVELEAARREDPDCLEALTGLAMLELAAGHMERAIGLFRDCVNRRPDLAEAWQQILESRKLTDPGDADLQAVRALLARPDLPNESRERLSYAMGKACDDLGLYDEAFGHIREANRLKRARLPAFDAAGWAAECSARLGEAETLPRTGSRRRRVSIVPIFIFGMPRSGTTLVDQILTSHPQIAGVGELPFLDARAERDDEALRNDYLAQLAATGARAVTNKFPGNFRHLPRIRRLFPEARLIHVIRDPLDTCLSIFFQDFPVGNTYANDLEDIAAYYRGYRSLVEAWAGRGSGVFEARYESLTADPEGASRRLLAYCGLNWAPECLEFYDNPRPVATLSRWQVRQPIFSGSTERWRHYEAHLGPLIEALGISPD